MRAVPAHLIIRVVNQTDLLKVYFTKSVVGTKFPKQTLGIDTFSILMYCSFHNIAWE